VQVVERYSPQVILDPSVLFTDDGLGWLEDAELRPYLSVSTAVMTALDSTDRWYDFSRWGVEVDEARFARVRAALDGITLFSFADVEDLPGETIAIRDALLQSDEPLAEALADEWIFVNTQSWAILAHRVRHTLYAFVSAGVRVYEVAREDMERALEAFRDALPPKLLEIAKDIGNFPRTQFPKLLIAGAEQALMLIPYVGVPLVVAGWVQLGVAVIAGDP